MVRLLVFLGAMVGAVFFAANNLPTLETALVGLQEASLLPIAAGVLLSVAAMINRGFLNRAAHVAVGLDVEPASMVRTAAVGFAANKVVKAAGASGLAVFVRSGNRNGHAPSKVAAACVLAAASSFFALGGFVLANLILLASADELSGWWVTAGAAFLVYAIVIVLAMVTATHRRDTARRVWLAGRRLIARIRRRPMEDETVGLDDLYEAMEAARRNGGWSARAQAHAIISKMLGAAMLLAAAVATGLPISTADVLLIYTTALVTALFSILPGGLGLVEATTAAMFVSAGAPLGVAVVAVALYRVFDLWIPVAAGAMIGRRELRRADADPRFSSEPKAAMPVRREPLVPEARWVEPRAVSLEG
ncbi:MAG: YbhN family protein [Actinomycetota bacterium]